MLEWIRRHLRNELALNTYLLVIIRVCGTGFGFFFWALSARLLSADQLGLASGVVSATMLLSGLAQLGLGYGLVRDLPHTREPVALINISIVTSLLAALVLALIFLTLLEIVSPALLAMRTQVQLSMLFIVFVLSCTLTQILNWVFLATRRLNLRLAKQICQAMFAIIFLLVLRIVLSGWVAVVAAYTMATLVAALVALLFLLPRAQNGYHFMLILPDRTRTRFARFSLINHTADQFERLPDTLLPLLVINQLGAGVGAYFYIAWTLARSIASWAGSTAESLFAEGARESRRFISLTEGALRLGLMLSGSMSFAMVLFGPLVLTAYGNDYVRMGSPLLILASLAAIPTVLLSIYINLQRMRARLRVMFFFLLMSIVGGLSLSFVGMRLFGLTGVGIGWLTAQLLVVCVAIIRWRTERMQMSRMTSPALASSIADAT